MDIDHKTEKEEQLERRKKVIFDMLNDKQYVPMKLKEMAMLLQIPKENRSELKAVLDALILEGKAEVTSKGKYRRATAKTVTGVFTAHPRGFGFVEVEGREEDVFIAEEILPHLFQRGNSVFTQYLLYIAFFCDIHYFNI